VEFITLRIIFWILTNICVSFFKTNEQGLPRKDLISFKNDGDGIWKYNKTIGITSSAEIANIFDKKHIRIGKEEIENKMNYYYILLNISCQFKMF
jgi:hypothetical protein